MRRRWDVQGCWNPWVSLGVHVDHEDPSVTLHLPGLIVAAGNLKQPGFRGCAGGWGLREREPTEGGESKMADEELGIGDHVIFVDERGRERDALLTAVHGEMEHRPSVNLVFVEQDEDRTDSYGRQVSRESSVVHEEEQSAHGMYWRAPE